MHITPDPAKAQSLVKMAKISLERLEKTDKYAYSSNTLVDYYDILHKLLDAKMLLEGIKFVGDGAHKQLIDAAGLPERERIFLQEMREYRNRISYEGFMVSKEYIERNECFIWGIINQLESRF